MWQLFVGLLSCLGVIELFRWILCAPKRDKTKNVKRVVVVGGSFSGVSCARALNQDSNFRVTLISDRNYFEYTPGILRAYVLPEHLSKLQCKLRAGKSEIVIDTANSVTPEEVKLASGRSLAYDYLVVATGSHYQFGIKPNNEATPQARQKTVEQHAETIRRAQHVIIVGGGFVGVEMAAEVAWMYPNKKCTLYARGSRILDNMPLKASQYATRWLQKHGVEIQTSYSFNVKTYEPKEGEVVIPCMGLDNAPIAYTTSSSASSPASSPSETKDEKQDMFEYDQFRRIHTDRYLRARNVASNVFVLGDVMIHDSNEVKMAYNAELNGFLTAKNIQRDFAGKPLLSYPEGLATISINPRLICCSLGKWDGFIVFNDLVIPGKLAALTKWVLEVTKVMQYQEKWLGLTFWLVAEHGAFVLNRLYYQVKNAVSKSH